MGLDEQADAPLGLAPPEQWSAVAASRESTAHCRYSQQVALMPAWQSSHMMPTSLHWQLASAMSMPSPTPAQGQCQGMTPHVGPSSESSRVAPNVVDATSVPATALSGSDHIAEAVEVVEMAEAAGDKQPQMGKGLCGMRQWAFLSSGSVRCIVNKCQAQSANFYMHMFFLDTMKSNIINN